jgi:hypothetical protein
MSDTTTPAAPAAQTADTGSSAPSKGNPWGVEELSDAAFESDSWDEPSGESGQAKFERELDAMLAEEESDPERGSAEKHVAKAKDDVQEITKKATAKPKSEPEPEKPSTYKVKLSGEEREVDAAKMAKFLGVSEANLKLLEPGAAERAYQKLWFAEQSQREGREAKKQFDEFLNGFSHDPMAAMEAILALPNVGQNRQLRQLATDYLARVYEEQSLPPEQRELLAAKRELQRIKAEQDRANQQAEYERQQEASKRFAADLKANIAQSLTEAGIPTDTRMIRRIVDLMQRERAEREADDTNPYSAPRDLIPALESELDTDIQTRFAKLGAEGFAKRFPEISKALGEYRVAQYRKNQAAQTQAADELDSPPARQGKPKKVRFDDLPWMK